MEGNNALSAPSEDDEDLEALRLAALQSLKKKQTGNEVPSGGYYGGAQDKFVNVLRGKPKRGKFSRPQQGWNARNGHFNNGWTRNSNLIAVPMVSEEKPPENDGDNHKLVLPQDRYCKTEEKTDGGKNDALTSKFDRYNNSGSESEDDEEDDHKDESEETGKSEGGEDTAGELKRTTSLEDLMAELENEIQGCSAVVKPKEETTSPINKTKKKRKISTGSVECEKPVEATAEPVNVLKENLKPESNQPPVGGGGFNRRRKWVAKPRRHNFMQPPSNLMHHRQLALPPPPSVGFTPPPIQTFPPPYNPIGFDNGVYVAPLPPLPPPVIYDAPPPPIRVQLPPRQLSPLTINTEAFSTSTLAPLSPRSAAFVLENRAIVEKRRRRSYSRSPSPPRFRRSKSPKRCSLSPRRLSTSPKRRSLSPSPVRKVLPPRHVSPSRKPIHDRLGLKPTITSAKPEPEEEKRSSVKEVSKPEAVLDPVLEARRKKFERNEISKKEGVIRLRIKEEETKKQEDSDDDVDVNDIEEIVDEETDAIDLDHKIDVLFSDEESDSDNEGRFKTKTGANTDKQKVSILPFTKLISNGTKTHVKGVEKRKRRRSRSPNKKKFTSPRKNNFTVTDSRKIEIKIKNPAKYDKTGEDKVPSATSGRKVVEISKANETEDNEDDNASGDLRAQLSRKRAERQKLPLPDMVPSRLLQNALQSVGFKQGRHTKNKEENATEGKLPIHMRLGALKSGEGFEKKGRKQKNKGSQEQV